MRKLLAIALACLLWPTEASVYKPRPSPSPAEQQQPDQRQEGGQAAGPLPPPQQLQPTAHNAAADSDDRRATP